MGAKAIQAKIIIENHEQLEHLWRTHKIFNKSLPFLIAHIFKMKRGKLGENYKAIYDSIMEKRNPAQASFGKLEPITQAKPPRKLGSGKNKGDWVEKALEINRSGNILFDRSKPPLAFGSEFWRKLCEMSIQLIHGHDELTENWKAEHETWLKEKAEWEEKHSEYMKVRSIFELFEKEVQGKITKRRRRWHLYLDFLKKHPELAGWRGKEAVIQPISTEGLNRIKKARPNKRNGIEAEEFFEANPELDAIDKLHKHYQTNYIRGFVKRKNSDGFKHRPTFTLPSPISHPAWYQFKKGATYKNLDIENGTVSLRVITSENGKGREGEWKPFRFDSDPRLKLFRKTKGTKKNRKGDDVEADKYLFQDLQLDKEREAEIKGIKLIFKNIKLDEKEDFKTGIPYLVFTCNIPDLKWSEKAKTIKWEEGTTGSGKKTYKRVIPDGLVTCALDLGIHHMAAATIRKDSKIIRTRFIWDKDKGRDGLQSGASLKHIAKHKWQLRKGLRERGKPIKGEESFVELRDHITSMGEDRFKKGARKIVSFAHSNGVDILILEKLEGFIPSAERERGINKALIQWNRGNLVKWIKQIAQDAGIRVIEAKQYWSSQMCSQCGSMGRRYTIVRNPEIKKLEVDFGEVKPLFGCPEDNCLLGVNGDFNASVNLHKIFYKESPFDEYGTIHHKDKKRDRIYLVNGAEISLDDVERKIQLRLAKKGLLAINGSEIDIPY